MSKSSNSIPVFYWAKSIMYQQWEIVEKLQSDKYILRGMVVLRSAFTEIDPMPITRLQSDAMLEKEGQGIWRRCYNWIEKQIKGIKYMAHTDQYERDLED